MSLTREDLHLGLHRFATKHDLERFATKQELAALREDTAQDFAATRRHLELVAEELASKIRDMLKGLGAQVETAGNRHASASATITSPSRGQSE